MAAKRPPRPTKRGQQDFYETMPGNALFNNTYDMFPSRQMEAEFDDQMIEDDTPSDREVRAKMVRQGLILLGLLLLQVVLFALLIRSTMNLG